MGPHGRQIRSWRGPWARFASWRAFVMIGHAAQPRTWVEGMGGTRWLLWSGYSFASLNRARGRGREPKPATEVAPGVLVPRRRGVRTGTIIPQTPGTDPKHQGIGTDG